MEIGYRTVLDADGSGTATSMIAYEIRSSVPFRAVIWSVRRQTWVYAPAQAATFLFDPDYQHRTAAVDRTAAEQISMISLRTQLPAEERLQEMYAEGAREGWDFGPPHP